MKWLKFLKDINRDVKSFFDIKAQGYLNDIPVYKPQKNTDSNCILLISPFNGVDEIFIEARKLGFHRIQIGNILELISTYDYNETAEIFLKDLFAINSERRYDIVVRYLAIDAYYGKNDYGFELYKKMQVTRTGYDFVENQFRNLIHSFDINGYDKDSFVTVFDDNLHIADGAHRIALCLYHNIKNISIKFISHDKSKETYYGLKWFMENGFNDKEIELIKDKADRLFQRFNSGEYTGVFWGSTLPFVEEAISDLRTTGVATNIVHRKFKREEYNNLIKAIYKIDDKLDFSRIDEKIFHLGQYPPEIVSFNLKMDLNYRIRKDNHLPISLNGEKIKKLIREKYKSRLDHYYSDVILSVANNLLQSDYINTILSPKINFIDILNKISDFNYVLMGIDVPYMPEDFPQSIPVGKNIDIIVLPNEYKLLVDNLNKISNTYNKQYEIIFIEKSNTHSQIRYEKFKKLIFMLDIFCDIEELNDKFVKDTIDSRIKKNEYFVSGIFYEYLYRLLQYSKNKNEWWHYKFLFDNKTIYDNEKIKKYSKIKLEIIQ